MVDVYLISGFLGSGKTSLLLHLLHDAKQQGKHPAVLMNEFGQLAVDTETLQTADGTLPVKEILNGCICCTGSENTEAQLQGLLVENEDVDVIFIETTGAAHPVEALDAVYSPLFADRLQVKGIITVVDLKRWGNLSALTPQMRALFIEQVRHAHFLIGNKMDLLTPGQLAETTMAIQSFAPRIPFIQTSQSRVKFQDIEKELTKAVESFDTVEFDGHGLPLQSKLLTFNQSVNRERFEQWVATLPETVYRMKGYVPLSSSKKPMSFQYAYGMMQWMPEEIKMKPQVVLIGEGIQSTEMPETIYENYKQ